MDHLHPLKNSYKTPDGQVADVGMGNAMDQEIIWDLFTMTLNSAEVLGIEDDLVNTIRKTPKQDRQARDR